MEGISVQNQPACRVLLLADTHIGLDFPLKPRIQRRRRGYDFLDNFRKALEPALNGEVDAVVHGGDLFDRSKVPDALVQIALEPLLEVAQRGVPVFLVPGNHERATIPLHIWRGHPNLYVFDQPGTFALSIHGLSVSFSGIPFTRKVRYRFRELLMATGWGEKPADIRLLCLHQAVEGAQVGPVDYTFRSGPDVIRGADIPYGFCALLSGHIHRKQVLRHDLQGRPLAAPVIYPGAVERTAFAEQQEIKGYVTLSAVGADRGGCLEQVRFHPLPTRPMLTLDFDWQQFDKAQMVSRLRSQLGTLDPNAVVRIRLKGELKAPVWEVFNAATLRSLAPESMNITISGVYERRTPLSRTVRR